MFLIGAYLGGKILAPLWTAAHCVDVSARSVKTKKEQALVIAALKGAGIFHIGVTKNISNKVMLCHRFQTNRHENQ